MTKASGETCRQAISAGRHVNMQIRGSINHPAHYQLDNGMEAIDVIRGVLGDKGYKAFCRGNTLKYLLRAGKKGLITDDLKKAAWYLGEEIKQYEGMDDECR